MRECEEMLKIVQRSRDLRLDLAGGLRLAACNPPEVAHMPSMPKVEASCQLEYYRTKSKDWPFSYLVARTRGSIKSRGQAASQLYFEKLTLRTPLSP